MKTSLERWTELIIAVLLLIAVGTEVYLIYNTTNAEIVMEASINTCGLAVAYIMAVINRAEKHSKTAEKKYFSLLAIFFSVLLSLCVFEDLLLALGLNRQQANAERIETLIGASSYILIWSFIAASIKLPSRWKKKILTYQICAALLIAVNLLVLEVLLKVPDGICVDVSIAIEFANGAVSTVAVVKSKNEQLEKVSLIILSVLPVISDILYYLLLEVYIQYAVGILALLVCFINILLSRGNREQSDRELAAKIQISVLPKNFSLSDRVEIYAESRAMEQVGGDFYDFSVLDDTHIALLMADVSGHGAPASMFMMQGISLFRGLILNDMPQTEVMYNLNNILCEYNNEGLFITAWFGILDTETGCLKYIDAGHGLASLLSPDGTVTKIKGKTSLVLSAMEGMQFRVNEITVKPGDTLFLYTDGVTEARNSRNELYEYERLEAVLRRGAGSCRELCGNVFDSVSRFSGKRPRYDDITVMAVNYRSGSQPA